MEKDPLKVAELAKRRQDENWRFRSVLKMLPRARIRQVNARARMYGEAAQAKMDCTTCAACCRNNWIPVEEHEVERLAGALRLSPAEVRALYVTHDEGEDGIDARPCPFLSGNLCTVYEARPDCCRTYPYIGGDIPSRSLQILERAEHCPIVFEMWERLKQDFGRQR